MLVTMMSVFIHNGPLNKSAISRKQGPFGKYKVTHSSLGYFIRDIDSAQDTNTSRLFASTDSTYSAVHTYDNVYKDSFIEGTPFVSTLTSSGE